MTYVNYAGNIWRHDSGLPALLMVEAFDRLCPGTYQGRRKPDVLALANAAWKDADYCLDAPGNMPAGSCYKCVTGPDKDDWIVRPTEAWRE